MLTLLRAAALSLAAVAMVAPTLAKDVENPPTFKASALLGDAAQGPGYQIEETVGSDGYLRLYNVETPWGVLAVHGDQMLEVRLKEILALDALERTANSSEFRDALVNAGLKPVEFAGNLVANPAGTVKKTISGVGQMFNSIGSGIRNAGKTQDSAAASISGAAKQRRIIAFNYGIDPYTDWPPLKQRLDQLSRAAAAGGLAVTGAFMLIPGAAGTVISNVATAETLNEMIRDYSAAQLMDINRKALRALGTDPNLVEELLANTHYTPVDMTALAGALKTMGKPAGIDAFIARAAEVQSRDDAFFMRKRAELMAVYQKKTGTITGFVTLGEVPFPLATTGGNGLAGIFPLDALSWTAETGSAITAITRAARAQGITGPLILGITGKATPLARKQVAALGWKLEEDINP